MLTEVQKEREAQVELKRLKQRGRQSLLGRKVSQGRAGGPAGSAERPAEETGPPGRLRELDTKVRGNAPVHTQLTTTGSNNLC